MNGTSISLGIGVMLAAVAIETACGQTFHSPDLPYPQRTVRIGFWPEGRNETFTPDVVQWLGERCSFLVLRSDEEGIDPYFDSASVVARFKQRFPALPVLHYDQIQEKRQGMRIDNMNFSTYSAHPEWMLKTVRGGVAWADRKPPVLQSDITNPEFQRYISGYTVGNQRRLGSDGVAWDYYFASLARKTGLQKHWMEKEAQWRPAASALLSSTRKAMNQSNSDNDREKLVIFNGLWFVWPGLMEKQRQLLPAADGACVEYFARNVEVPDGVENERADFDQYVLSVLDVMRDHPDKIYLVHARSPRYVYLDYEQDYLIQRYGIASFLLGMTPRAMFKYHSHFQADYHPPGRSYGMSYYEDYDIDLGMPLGERFEIGGIHQRRFTKGLVAVAPMHRGDRTLPLAGKRYFTPEGKLCQGQLTIPEGNGVLLLSHQPAPPPSRLLIDNFEDGEPGMWRFPVRDENVTVQSDNANRYLRVRASANPVQPYHERRIQPIRSLHPVSKVQFRIRSQDKAGAMLIRVEVDDANRKSPYAVLVVRPSGGSFSFQSTDVDIPYGHVGVTRANLKAPFLSCETTSYRAEGLWQTVEINLPETFRRIAPQLAPRRIPEMRLIGEADLDDIILMR
jgi:hypothetical protein